MRSTNTLIGLGPDRGHAQAALELVTDIWLHIEDKKRKGVDKEALARKSSADSTNYIKIDSVQPVDKRSGALAILLQSPWFERCWVSRIEIDQYARLVLTRNVHCLDPPRSLCVKGLSSKSGLSVHLRTNLARSSSKPQRVHAFI
jgi:hypothetical protein